MATLRAIRVTDIFVSWGRLPFKTLYTPKDSDAYKTSELSMNSGMAFSLIETFFCRLRVGVSNISCGLRTSGLNDFGKHKTQSQ